MSGSELGESVLPLTARPGLYSSAKWLTEEEKALAEARIKSENAGSVAVVEKLRKDTLLSGILNINTWLLALQFLFVNVSVQGVSVFMVRYNAVL